MKGRDKRRKVKRDEERNEGKAWAKEEMKEGIIPNKRIRGIEKKEQKKRK